MMKIRNAISSEQAASNFVGVAFVPSEDIALIQELVRHTVVPRHFIIQKASEQFEFIAQRKQLVAFKTSESFQYILPSADPDKQNEAVKAFIDTFGTFSDDDELTIKRVDADHLINLPDFGVNLDNIDFSAKIIAPTVSPAGPALRIVVDNQHAQNEIVEAPVRAETTEILPLIIQDTSVGVSGAVRKFYKHMRVHAKYTILKSRTGETLDSYGMLPDFDQSVLDGLVEEIGTFNTTTSRSLGTAPMMVAMVSERQENIAMIHVISSERILIAEVSTAKLGRVMIDWNLLLATKATDD